MYKVRASHPGCTAPADTDLMPSYDRRDQNQENKGCTLRKQQRVILCICPNCYYKITWKHDLFWNSLPYMYPSLLYINVAAVFMTASPLEILWWKYLIKAVSWKPATALWITKLTAHLTNNPMSIRTFQRPLTLDCDTQVTKHLHLIIQSHFTNASTTQVEWCVPVISATQEAELGGCQVESQLGLQSRFKSSLGYLQKPCLKTARERTRGYSSVIEHLTFMCEALGSIPSTRHKKRRERRQFSWW